jgi:hypothetical protein
MLWSTPDVPPGAVDVVVASDILYDPKNVPVVVQLLTHLLRTPTAAEYVSSGARDCSDVCDVVSGEGLANNTGGVCATDCIGCEGQSGGPRGGSQNRDSHPAAYIVTTIRNPTTLQLWLDMAEEAGLRVEGLTAFDGVWSLGGEGVCTIKPVLPALFQGIRALEDRNQYVLHRVTFPCSV